MPEGLQFAGCGVCLGYLVEADLDLSGMLGDELLLALDQQRFGLGQPEAGQKRPQDKNRQNPRENEEYSELSGECQTTMPAF